MILIDAIEQRLATLKPADRRALLIVTVFLSFTGTYLYIIEPLIIAYNTAHSTINELSDQQSRYQRQVMMLPRREARLTEYASERKAMERRFNLQIESPEAAVSRTITELTYYARLADVSVIGIRPLDAIDRGDLLEIPFEIETNGVYENLHKFFYYIDTSPSLLAITDLDLTVPEEGLYQARLVISDVVRLRREELAPIAGVIEPQNRLRIALSHWTGYAPLVIAKANGYLDTPARQVDFIQVDDSVTIQRLLASGEADAIGTTLPALLDYWVNGIPLSVIMPLNSTMGTEGIVVHPDSDIRTVADLQNQIVAADEQGLLQYILFQALDTHGMSLSDVEVKSLAASQVARDMSNGTLAAGVTREPYLSALISNNLARLVYASDDRNGLILDVLAITPEAAEQKTDAIQQLVDGLQQARQFIKEQPGRAIEIVADWQGQPAEITQASLSRLTLFDSEATHAFFSEDQLSGSLEALETYFRALDKPFPLLTRDDIVNSLFFDRAAPGKLPAMGDTR